MPPTIALLPLVNAAGLVALVLLCPHVRSGSPSGRLAGEVFVTTLAFSALACGLLALVQRLPW